MTAKTLLIAPCILTPLLICCQNLISNGDFETKKQVEPQKIYEYDHASAFRYEFPGWEMTAGELSSCTCNYVNEKVDTTSHWCLDGALPFRNGCNVIELGYGPNCNAPWMKRPGCSSYLGQRLAQPLVMGKTYALTMDYFIQQPDDPDYTRHIGMSLYNEQVSLQANMLLDGGSFPLDTIVYNSWQSQTWYFRPTCDLSFVVFGVFHTAAGPPTHGRYNLGNHFFLDNLVLREVDRRDAPWARGFCKTPPELAASGIVANAIVLFSTNEDELTVDEQAKLDLFASKMLEQPRATFTMSGHTDNTGSDHHDLAARRIAAVCDYLRAKYGISELRFLKYPAGADRPRDSNDNEEGRKQNRRVEINFVNMEPETLVYRRLLEAVWAKEQGEAIKLFSLWLSLVPEKNIHLARYDPRLRGFTEQPPVRKIYDNRLDDLYRKIGGGRRTLDSLFAADQQYRTLGRYIENFGVYHFPLDSGQVKWDVVYEELSPEMIAERDERHLPVMCKWLDKYGWPDEAAVGDRAAKTPALILIHAEDTTAMQQHLPLLYKSARAGKADWAYYAMLADRLSVVKKQPQRYGTQFNVLEDGTSARAELVNPALVNEWRREIGLEPLRGYE
ncbi:MAG: OmpA family protein [Saprospiraceae bacterium]